MTITEPTYVFVPDTKILHVHLDNAQFEAVKCANLPSDESEEAKYGRSLLREMRNLHDQYAWEFGSCEIRCYLRSYDGGPL